jgi:hypothetical protein
MFSCKYLPILKNPIFKTQLFIMENTLGRLSDELRTYKLANGWKALMILLVPVLIIVMSTAAYFIIADMQEINLGLVFLALLMLGFAGFFVYAFIDIFKGRTVTGDGRILHIDPLNTKELLYEDVSGFKHDDKYIYIYSKNKNKSYIKISTYIANSNELICWLGERFPNLDLEEFEVEQEEILANDEYGLTEELRCRAFERAKKQARVANITGFILAALVFFYPEKWIVTLAMLFPIGLIFLIGQSNGLIRLNGKKNSAYPIVITSFIFITGALGLFLLNNISLIHFSDLLIVSGIVFCALAPLVYLSCKELRIRSMESFISVFFIGLFFFVYSFESCTAVNCLYDKSESVYYYPKVLNKRISSGKHTSYFLELESWGSQVNTEEEDVGSGKYNHTAIGDKVTVEYRKGALGAPWYIVY